MNASDHAFCRWFADPEAKAFFAPEGLLDSLFPYPDFGIGELPLPGLTFRAPRNLTFLATTSLVFFYPQDHAVPRVFF